MIKSKLSVALGLALASLALGCTDSESNTAAAEVKAETVAVAETATHPASFDATVESLQQYQTPEWFRDAKLGIYMHWGAYSVAERGEWYARKLYIEGTKEYKHHLETYGHPSEFGYKDFIPLWKAENWDPMALVGLFKEAGAKYFSPAAVHHDNFDLWDSKHHEWNSVNMGPKRDITGEWKKATEHHGLRFGVTTHLSRAYSWLNVANQSDTKGPKAGVPYDGDNEAYDGFYFPKHDDTHKRAPENAPKWWRDQWAARMKDLIEKYDPDHFYFDCAVPFRGDDAGQTGMDVISYLYNNSLKTNGGKLEAVMATKARPWQGLHADGMTTLDYERGKASHILPEPWQTDDSIGPWGYNTEWPHGYMDANMVIDKMLDIVSKNGNMLLNVPIKADGTLDEKTTEVLKGMGVWMKANGEGIYGSRPWYIFGEGHTNEVPHKATRSPFKKGDIRFTKKDGFVYAYVLAWPGANKVVTIENITTTNYRLSAVKNVSMLGFDGDVTWKQAGDGLQITMPSKKVGDHAFGFKIEFVEPQ